MRLLPSTKGWLIGERLQERRGFIEQVGVRLLPEHRSRGTMHGRLEQTGVTHDNLLIVDSACPAMSRTSSADR